MAKTYKKISGTWYPIKKIFKNIGDTWSEVKKLYQKSSGTWQVVHSGALEYTFAGSITATVSTGILLSDYVNPSLADEFVITVNNGVTLSGMKGTVGAQGAQGAYGVFMSNCHGSWYWTGGNGGNGGRGGKGIDFTGFSGKKITFINNGTIKGGDGGNGGNGGGFWTPTGYGCGVEYSGCGGSGGSGEVWSTNSAIATVTLSPNAPVSGSAGSAGLHGTPYSINATSGFGC